MIHTYTYLQVILEKQDKESVLKYEGLWGGGKKTQSTMVPLTRRKKFSAAI